MPILEFQEQKTIRQYIEIINRRKWYILIPTILAIAFSITLSFKLPKEYLSSTLIMVERQQVPEDYVKSTVTASISDRLKNISQQVLSRTNLLELSREINLYQDEIEEVGEGAVVAKLRSKIDVKVEGKGKQAFSISFRGQDPEKVMQVTNALASRFIDENLKVREEQAEGTSEFLKNELLEAKKKLDTLDQELKRTKMKYMGGLPAQLNANLRTLDRLQLELQTTSDQIQMVKDRSFNLKSQIEEIELQARSTDTNFISSPEETGQQLQQLKKNLAELGALYKDNYPDIVILKEKIRKLESKPIPESNNSNRENSLAHLFGNEKYRTLREEYIQSINELSSLETTKGRLIRQIDDYEKRVEQTPMVEERLKNLMRDYDMAQKHYELIMGKSINARISENLERRQKGERFRVIDPANFPEKPFKPNRRKIVMMGTAGGLGFGFGLALLIELMAPCFRKPEDFEGIIDAHVLATIPKYKIPKKKNKPQGYIKLVRGKRVKAS